LTKFMQRLSWGILPSALVAFLLTPLPALCENAADTNQTETSTNIWDGKDFKFLSKRVDSTEKKDLRVLYDTVASGKLDKQAYYDNVGENFSMVWDWTDRKEIAKMLKRANATAMKEYHAGRLDKALARETASLATAADFLERILGGTEHIQIEDRSDEHGDGAHPLRWLTVFQKAHIKPNVWQDDRTYFPPSDYIGAVNNYAFFLQLKGEHEKAIPIFQKIITIDPDRSVTYLNLGDSLFATGAKGAAETAYKNYELHLDKHTIIPERVIERLKGNL
jgi:tetratricopeptide (TPR) repeat protein